MDAQKRESNFSQQECMLLAETMGKESNQPELTYHQLFRHKFTSGITSHTKREMWKKVAEVFNASATINRSPEKLEKKWLNMVAKHRLLYSDYTRDRALTGGGQCSKQLSLLTEAVMAVIGKESAAVAGAASSWMDTSFIQLQMLNESSHTSVTSDAVVPVTVEHVQPPEFAPISSTCACQFHPTEQPLESLSVEELTKMKLILEIRYLNKKLKKSES